MMKIKIEDIQNAPESGLNILINLKELEDLKLNTPVTGSLNFIATSYGIEVEGEIKTELSIYCDRCLKQFIQPISINIKEEFVYGNLIDSDTKEFELTGENFVEDLEDREDIDLTEFIYQEIILNVPSQKLCNIACEGTEHYKEVKREQLIDPRLEIFKKLTEEQ